VEGVPAAKPGDWGGCSVPEHLREPLLFPPPTAFRGPIAMASGKDGGIGFKTDQMDHVLKWV